MKKKNAVNLVKTLISTVAIWLCLISVNSFAVDEINTGFFNQDDSVRLKQYEFLQYWGSYKKIKSSVLISLKKITCINTS